jgi:peptidoglycan/LPS O-acetylase OafA/YrhL
MTVVMLFSRSTTQNDVLAPMLFALAVGWAARRTTDFPAPLVALGGVSYAFYLVHQPVLGAVAKLWSTAGATTANSVPFLAACLLGLALSLALAVPLERFGRWSINAVKRGC